MRPSRSPRKPRSRTLGRFFRIIGSLISVRRWLTPSGHGPRPCHPTGCQGGAGGGGGGVTRSRSSTGPARSADPGRHRKRPRLDRRCGLRCRLRSPGTSPGLSKAAPTPQPTARSPAPGPIAEVAPEVHQQNQGHSALADLTGPAGVSAKRSARAVTASRSPSRVSLSSPVRSTCSSVWSMPSLTAGSWPRAESLGTENGQRAQASRWGTWPRGHSCSSRRPGRSTSRAVRRWRRRR